MCNGTGKQYSESVEELLSETVLKESKGYEAKFHGAGREDIDVRMLGSGRPFVLEIKEPKIRKLNLNKIEKEVNEINANKTKYNNLKFVKRSRKAEIKVSSPDTYKVYRALVNCEEEIKKVRAIQDDAYKKTGEIRKDNSLSKEQKEEKAKEINKDKNRKIREVIGKEKFSKFMDIRKRQREEKSTNKEDKSAE